MAIIKHNHTIPASADSPVVVANTRFGISGELTDHYTLDAYVIAAQWIDRKQGPGGEVWRTVRPVMFENIDGSLKQIMEMPSFKLLLETDENAPDHYTQMYSVMKSLPEYEGFGDA